jgi:PAS domain S-box-containing protein
MDTKKNLRDAEYRRKLLHKKFLQIFFIFILPIISVSLLISFRMLVDFNFPSYAFSLFLTLVFLHSYFSGTTSGIWTALLTSFVGNLFFIGNSHTLEFDTISRISTLAYFLQALLIAVISGRFLNSERNVRKIVDKLPYSQKNLREIIDSVFQVIAIVSTNGDIIEANKTFFNIVPGGKNSVLGHNITNTLPWSYSKTVQKRLKRALKKVDLTHPIKYDEKIKVLDDKLLDVEVNLVSIDENLDYVTKLIVVSATDISSRKLYETTLIRGRESYSKLIKSNIIGMVIGDYEGNILEANKAFLDTIGYYSTDLHNKKLNLKDFIPPEYQQEGILKTQMLIAQGSYNPTEIQLVQKDGNRVSVMISGVAISEKRNEYLRLILDLSSQKELERKKDEFISIASHELKTPLTTLKGYVQILNQRLQKKQDENSRLTIKIDDQLNKLTDLINELLDITKIQYGKFTIRRERINLVDVIKNSIDEMEPYRTDQKIKFHYKKDLYLEIDRFRIGQVLNNLLTNAIKHSKSDGEINIRIKKMEEFVKVSIEDFGHGIAPDKIDKIFQKFYQATDNAGEIEGLGLGLYISSEIIKDHGGEIGVESIVDKGSTFYFLLPLS